MHRRPWLTGALRYTDATSLATRCGAAHRSSWAPTATLAKNQTSSRNRHLDTRTQFIRDAVDYLQITPLYTPTDVQPADGLTKAVGADVIRRHLPYYTGTCNCPDMHNIYT